MSIKKIDRRRFLIINVGVVIMCIGLYFFILSNNLVMGGISGLALVLQHYWPQLPVSLLMALMNLILFILAFALIGPEFGGYTIYASFATSAYLRVFENLFPLVQFREEDLMLCLIFGAAIGGVGMGIILYENASTGGTDILGKIINMTTKVDIGKSILAADVVIVLMGVRVFGVRLGLYALLGSFMQAAFIDYAIAGFHRKVQMEITSKKDKEINRFIQDELKRGTTYYETTGGYSLERRHVLTTVLSKREYLRVKEFIEEVDPEAFVAVHYISEVMGEGFTYDSFGHFRLPPRKES